MLEATKSKSKAVEENALFNNLIIFVWHPIKAGLAGFAIFFTVLIVAKYLVYSFGVQPVFEINIDDVYICLIGFGFYFLIKFLGNFNPQKK